MKMEFLIWSDGDPSVGMNGVSFKATFELTPELDADVIDAEDMKAFKASMEEGIKKVIRDHAEYFDDMTVHIATPDELRAEEEAEIAFENGGF